MLNISRTGTSTLERRNVNINVSLESAICWGHGYANYLCKLFTPNGLFKHSLTGLGQGLGPGTFSLQPM